MHHIHMTIAAALLFHAGCASADKRIQHVGVPAFQVIAPAISPTLIPHTVMRGGPGAFASSRGNALHKGVDIVAVESSTDKSIYVVRAVAGGLVAYAQFNGEAAESGYGYTVVIDHGDGLYTLYAHMATLASGGLVSVNQEVESGQVIGYMADLANGEKSSGNVLANVVAPYDKIQLHFEEFTAAVGRRSSTSIAVLKEGGELKDPTADLKNLGYTSNDNPPLDSDSDDTVALFSLGGTAGPAREPSDSSKGPCGDSSRAQIELSGGFTGRDCQQKISGAGEHLGWARKGETRGRQRRTGLVGGR
jgi:hypothetical protein